MLNGLKIFGNLFHDKGMSRQHLLGFSKDSLQRLISANATHIYDIIIAFLTPMITVFSDEISNEDTNKNIRLGKTRTVDQVTADFVKTMNDRKGGISKTFGGENSEGYLEFYPKGQKEYSKPTREDMALFATRIGKAALKHDTALGPVISAELQAFEPDFNAARGMQVAKIGDIANDSTAISANQLILELGLTKVVHQIAYMYPGNTVVCNALFNFNLLYPVTHHPHLVLDGILAAGGTVEVINKTFTETYTIEIKNNGTNASFWIWLGATALDGDNSMALEVKSGKMITIKPSDIGDLKKTFMLIKNDSSVNATSYEVTIIG